MTITQQQFEAHLATTVVTAIVLVVFCVMLIADNNALRRECDEAKAAAAISQRAAEDLWATIDRIAQHQKPE